MKIVAAQIALYLRIAIERLEQQFDLGARRKFGDRLRPSVEQSPLGHEDFPACQLAGQDMIHLIFSNCQR